MLKKCSVCEVRKSLDEFSRKANLSDGFNTKCKSCVKDVEDIRRFGCTYKQLIEFYGDTCGICGKQESVIDTRTGSIHSLCIDHDHRCCKKGYACPKCIRGLLCRTCNYQLGVFEKPLWVNRALEYLDSHSENKIENYDILKQWAKEMS